MSKHASAHCRREVTQFCGGDNRESVCDEIEHDHTLHESLHHNEHRQHPSPCRHPSFRSGKLTVRNLGIYAMQGIYQAAIHAVTAHMDRLRSSLRGSLPDCVVQNCRLGQPTRSTSRTSAGSSHTQNIGQAPGLHVEQSKPGKVTVVAERKPRASQKTAKLNGSVRERVLRNPLRSGGGRGIRTPQGPRGSVDFKCARRRWRSSANR